MVDTDIPGSPNSTLVAKQPCCLVKTSSENSTRCIVLIKIHRVGGFNGNCGLQLPMLSKFGGGELCLEYIISG